MASRYVPERGDVVWLTFHPQAGHERKAACGHHITARVQRKVARNCGGQAGNREGILSAEVEILR